MTLLIDVQVDISSKQLLFRPTDQSIAAVSGKLQYWRRLRLLQHENGALIYPQNYYLHHLLKVKGNKNVNTAAYALLSFTRWLTQTNCSYRDVGEDHKESPVWLFSNHLVNLVKRSSAVESPLSISTARSYLRVVIDFYKFLHHKGILKIDETHKPFNFENRRIFLSNISDNALLSHTHRRTYIEVQTTDVMSRFPKTQQSSPHNKLTPISVEHLGALFNQLKFESIRTQLMFKLSLLTGLRLSEVVSFPEDLPYSNQSKTEFTIGPHNGVLTKFGKTRTVEIPKALLTELVEYKHSAGRLKCKIKKTGTFLHEPMFYSQKGTMLSPKTLQKLWSNCRGKIAIKVPDWLYRFHDCRSTYATNYLITESASRQLPYEFLMTELAELMGHNSTVTTQKYVAFLDFKKHWLNHASLINKFADEVCNVNND